MAKSTKISLSYLIVIAATALVSNGCGVDPVGAEKKDEKKQTEGGGAGDAPDGPFLALADFASSNLYDISSGSIANHVRDDAEFTTNKDEDDDEPSACDPMLESVKVAATKDRMLVAAAVDLTACTEQDFFEGGSKDPGEAIEVATTRIYVDFRCEGADLTIHDGKTLKQIGPTDIDPCIDLGGTRATAVFHAETHLKGTLVIPTKKQSGADGTETMTIDVTTLELGGSSESAGCVRVASDGLSTLEGTCLAYKIEKVASEKGHDKLQKLAKTGLSFKKGDKYFRSGKITADINGWQGDVVYTAGDVAPTWTLAKGGKTETGTYKAGGKASKAATAPEEEAVPKDSAEGDTSAADKAEDGEPSPSDSSSDSSSSSDGLGEPPAGGGAASAGLALTGVGERAAGGFSRYPRKVQRIFSAD